MKKIVKPLLWTIGILLALPTLLSLLAGPVAKGVANANGEKLVGRHVHLDHAGVNLFNGHVNLRGLQVYEDDGATAFAGFDTLDVRAHLLKLVGKTVDIRSVVLSGLDVNVTQEGEHFNFSSMLGHFKSNEEKEKDTTPSEWVVRLGDIRLNHAHASYHDIQRDKEWRIADMNLRVPGFVIGGKESSQAGLNLELEDGGRLNVATKYDAASNDFSADMHLTGFALRNIKEYLAESLYISDITGVIDAHLKASGNLSEVTRSHISGDIDIEDVALADKHGASVAKLASLYIGITDINIDANRFAFGTIALEGLVAAYEQWDDGNTVSRLVIKHDTPDEAPVASDAPATKQSKPMQFKVDNVKASGCTLTYTDHTIPDGFSFPVTNLSLEATRISTGGTNNARLRATLPGGGNLILRWQGRIDNWKSFQDINLGIKGLDMRQLSPLAAAYTGYPIDDGIFGLTSHLTINNSQLDNTNTIDIYKATVGKRRKDIEPKQKIPLKAALYVLKDKDDKIEIEMPVKGNVSDPEFNYMKAVWKTLGNLLVKVATSPARAIAGAMGVTDGSLDFIAVSPDQRSLSSEQYHALSTLAGVAATDSMLVLNLELHTADTTHASHLNRLVTEYMLEQGIGTCRLNVTTGDAPIAGEPSGYSVSSELKIEE